MAIIWLQRTRGVRIKQLSSTIANQIAAGEVIENPASVVKELLENALDATATIITVDIGFGGLNQIKVSDNGKGIVADDLCLAIAPHATSKLTQLEDLSTLSSMGFRGEALASIASISHLTISSKPATQKNAMMLTTGDDSSYQLSTCARSEGTTIDVRDLFYNAPVRRRFLRTERSEFLAIEHMVKRFALSAPHITLHLIHNGKQVLELPAALCEQTRRLRIQKILGKSFVDSSIYLNIEHANMKLTGFISGETYQRSQNDKQWIYLNQRMVKDKLLYHAFKNAYENKLYPGRHPACLLYLTIPSQEVDVNVHPTKHEVRFQQPRLVHDFIGKHVNEAFMQTKQNEPILSSPDKPVFLCESYIERPKSAQMPSFTQQSTHWLIVNKQFGLLHWKDLAYLFNIASAQKAYLLHFMRPPLASRPLLVPIHHECHQTAQARLKSSIKPLAEFGIILELNEKKAQVKTLPILLPQLNIKQLITRIIDTPPKTTNEWLNVFLACIPIDADQLSMDEKESIGDYLVQCLEQKKEIAPWCVQLSVKRCQELMHA